MADVTPERQVRRFTKPEQKAPESIKYYVPHPESTPCPPGHVRFVCVSDTHTLTEHLVVPDGDVLLHAGDFSNIGQMKDIVAFSEWLGRLPHRHKVVIAGNHDLTFEVDYYLDRGAERFHRGEEEGTSIMRVVWRATSVWWRTDPRAVKAALKNCIYLEDSGCEVEGFKIWGSPWQPEFYDWAFNLPIGGKLAAKWDLIPSDTDILITHGPPKFVLDLTTTHVSTGCPDLLSTIQKRVKPKLHVFGHIHESYGVDTDGTTVYANASTCTFRYRPTNPALVFDIPRPGAASVTPSDSTAVAGTTADAATPAIPATPKPTTAE